MYIVSTDEFKLRTTRVPVQVISRPYLPVPDASAVEIQHGTRTCTYYKKETSISGYYAIKFNYIEIYKYSTIPEGILTSL